MTSSNIGLAIATAMSLTNVLKDVTAKRVLQRFDVFAVTFWIRILSALGFTAVLFAQGIKATAYIHDGGPLFGIAFLALSPKLVFAIYLLLDVLGVATAVFLYNRALQISPLSLCAPFLAFTPIFLLGTGAIFLHEMPSWPKAFGAILILVGSVIMHGDLLRKGLLAPALAIYRDKGTRYSLLTAFLFAITNPVDKKLVLMSSAEFQGFVYGIGICIFFGIMVAVKRADWIGVIRSAPLPLILAGILDCSALLLQFLSYRYLDVLVAVSIKRAGIIFAVLMGWLFFHEKNIRLRLLAASTMFVGVAVMYFIQSVVTSLEITAAAIVVAAFVWKHSLKNEVIEEPISVSAER
jgi:drug/metabolite transporter (DMT)-like permease